MSQEGFQKMRENFRKQVRRQQLQKRFSQRRQQLSSQLQYQQTQFLISTLPMISLKNYEENRFTVCDFARSIDHSYQLLPLVGVVYQYLLQNPKDLPSWEILTYLSYYEEFEVAQTQEFAERVRDLMLGNYELGSELVHNLSSMFFFVISVELPKCRLLCCRLVDMNGLECVGEALERLQHEYTAGCCQENGVVFFKKDVLELSIYNLLMILTEFFVLQPMLEIQQMGHICSILNRYDSSNKFHREVHTETIFKLISNAVQEFPCQAYVIDLLVKEFTQTLINNFFTYQQQAIKLLKTCVNLKMSIPYELIKSLYHSIKSQNTNNRVTSLQVLQSILYHEKQSQKMQIEKSSQQSNQGFSLLQLNSIPTLQQFTSMFRPTPKQDSTLTHNRIINRKILFSQICGQNYATEIRSILELRNNSNSKTIEQISAFLKCLIQGMIQEIQEVQPIENVLALNDALSKTQDMRFYLIGTLEIDDFYVFIGECLQSQTVQTVTNALQVVYELLLYFIDQNDDQIEQKDSNSNEQQEHFYVTSSFLIGTLQKFSIPQILKMLLQSQNISISRLASDILDLIHPEQQDI